MWAMSSRMNSDGILVKPCSSAGIFSLVTLVTLMYLIGLESLVHWRFRVTFVQLAIVKDTIDGMERNCHKWISTS